MIVLVGHEHAINLLEKTASVGRPPHAYLFTGRDGIGKKLVAMSFACMLNCPDRGADPTGECSVCRRILGGAHPDVCVELPERGMIRIDRVRQMQSFFRYAPVEGRYRVAIIDDAHVMNSAAQNALLKTLEEPPPNRIIVLVTSKPFQLLSTVRSRCRRVRFGPLPREALVHLLTEHAGISGQRVEALAAAAGGSLSRALVMNAAGFSELREQVIDFLRDPVQHGIRGVLEFSALLSADRNRFTQAIDVARSWVRDVLTAGIGLPAERMLNLDALDRIASSAQDHAWNKWLRVYEELGKAEGLLESSINVNRTLVSDVMALRIARVLAGSMMGIPRPPGGRETKHDATKR